MFPVTHLLSLSITRGLAALLVLTLSVVSGVRAGFDQSRDADDDRPALMCELDHVDQADLQLSASASAPINSPKSLYRNCLPVHPTFVADVRCPTTRLGSAGGARAPCVSC